MTGREGFSEAPLASNSRMRSVAVGGILIRDRSVARTEKVFPSPTYNYLVARVVCAERIAICRDVTTDGTLRQYVCAIYHTRGKG